jgi:hypothetical protein
MKKKVSKLTFISYTHVASDKFKQGVPPDVEFANNHPYKIAEIILRSGSELNLNPFAQINVRDYAADFSTRPWREEFKNLTIFLNGGKFKSDDFDKCYSLEENDIIEISLFDPQKNTLTHNTIIITKFQYSTNTNPG